MKAISTSSSLNSGKRSLWLAPLVEAEVEAGPLLLKTLTVLFPLLFSFERLDDRPLPERRPPPPRPRPLPPPPLGGPRLEVAAFEDIDHQSSNAKSNCIH